MAWPFAYCAIQDFSYTDLHQIVYEDDLCLDVPKNAVKVKVDIQMCHYMGGNQKWDYRNKVSTWTWSCNKIMFMHFSSLLCFRHIHCFMCHRGTAWSLLRGRKMCT